MSAEQYARPGTHGNGSETTSEEVVSSGGRRLAANDPRHGTTNGYTNLGCRCARCREAHRLRHMAWRHRTGYSEPREVYGDRVRLAAELRDNHGTESRYRFGCRCAACRDAASAGKYNRRMNSSVPCSHGCGRTVDSINRRDPSKPYECRSCATKRINAERKAAATTGDRGAVTSEKELAT